MAVLRGLRARLAPGGVLLVIEPRVSDKLEENINPLAAMFYGFSMFHCMTQSLAHGGAGLGACLGPTRTKALFAEAGFAQTLDIKSPTNLFMRRTLQAAPRPVDIKRPTNAPRLRARRASRDATAGERDAALRGGSLQCFFHRFDVARGEGSQPPWPAVLRDPFSWLAGSSARMNTSRGMAPTITNTRPWAGSTCIHCP